MTQSRVPLSAEVYPRARAKRDPGGGSLPPLLGGRTGGLIELPRYVIDARTLSAAILCAAGASRPPRSPSLSSLLDRLNGPGDLTATLAGARIMAGRDILIGRDSGRGGLPTLATSPGETVVWDGRFELTAEGTGVVPLAGRMARLPKAERATLADLPAWVRPTLPAHLHPDGRVTLAQGRLLAHARLEAALGLVQRESDI